MVGQSDGYFRRDQKKGVSAPNLLRDCSYAEHIVHARGKRTRFTSVSLDPAKIRDFGDATYQLLEVDVNRDGHSMVEHNLLMAELRAIAQSGSQEDRPRALQAMRYARSRKEGIVDWQFRFDHIDRKELEGCAFWGYPEVLHTDLTWMRCSAVAIVSITRRRPYL